MACLTLAFRKKPVEDLEIKQLEASSVEPSVGSPYSFRVSRSIGDGGRKIVSRI